MSPTSSQSDESIATTESRGSRRSFLKAAGAAGASGLAGLAGCAGGSSTPTIKMLGWTSYGEFAQTIEEELDVKLDVTKSSSSAKMFSAWNAGQNEEYDICVPNNNYVPKFIDAGLVAPVDKEAVSNYDGMYDKFQEFAETQFAAEGTSYGVPTRFGWYGYSYNAEKLPSDHEQSYDVLFSENYEGTDLDGQIMMFDNHFKSMSAAALQLGFRDAFEGEKVTLSQDQIDEVKQALIDQKPLLEGYTDADATFTKAYKSGNATAGLTGRYMVAELILDGQDWIEMATPKEGSLAWFEGGLVSSESDHKEKAWEVVNEYINPTTAAEFSEAAGILSTNPNATEHLDGKAKELLSVDPSRLDAMIPFKQVENEESWISAWEQVKSA